MIRRPPKRPDSSTRPAWASVTTSGANGACPERVLGAWLPAPRSAAAGGTNRHQPALVGDVERVEAQQLARAGHRHRPPESPSPRFRRPRRRPGRSRSGRRPARRASDRGGSGSPARRRAWPRPIRRRRAVALQGTFEPQPLADRHDGHAVPAQSPLSRMTSPGRTRAGEISTPGRTQPMPAVLMKMRSALPRSTTFVSPVTIRTPAARAVSAIEATMRRSVSNSRPSSRMKPCAQIGRFGPRHRQVVDRPADGQLADVAAGKHQRTNHEAIGRKRQPRAGDRQHGRVVGRRSGIAAGARWAEGFCLRFRTDHWPRTTDHCQTPPETGLRSGSASTARRRRGQAARWRDRRSAPDRPIATRGVGARS